MKLRYVGAVPTTFITGGVGEMHPGEEFSVDAELAEAFLSRADVEVANPLVDVGEDPVGAEEPTAEEEVEEPPSEEPQPEEEPGQSVATDGGDPEMMSEENSGFVPDDH